LITLFYLILIIRFLPLLKAAASKESSARVIHIGSQNGLVTKSLKMIPYDASKAAVHNMAMVMGSALSEHHINVNAIALGFFRSNLNKDFIDTEAGIKFQKTIPVKRHGYPEEIAGTCLWLASKAGGYVTGTTISVDGGGTTGMLSSIN
jgi:NAD(P)-dependent dehydrogenase (short-subunit alcohol dehydrogenase family)